MTEPVFGSLYERLTAYGDIVGLSLRVDLGQYETEIAPWSGHFVHYNPNKPSINRHGLSLTSLDGGMSGTPDLTSLGEHNRVHGTRYTEQSFQTVTPAYEALTSLHKVMQPFVPLGRCHILRLGEGGFFPPHRDEFTKNLRYTPVAFRIVVPLINADPDTMVFLHEDERAHLEQGRAYFMNTCKSHSVFSFRNNCQLLVMNVPFTLNHIQTLLGTFSHR